MRHRNEKSTQARLLTMSGAYHSDMVLKHRPCSGLGGPEGSTACLTSSRVMLKAARPQNPHGEENVDGTDFVFKI